MPEPKPQVPRSYETEIEMDILGAKVRKSIRQAVEDMMKNDALMPEPKPQVEAGVGPAGAHARVVTEEQISAIAQAAAREEVTKNAVSKTEFDALREDFKALREDFKELRKDFKEFRKDLTTLHNDFNALEVRMVKWFAGTAIAIVASVVSVVSIFGVEILSRLPPG